MTLWSLAQTHCPAALRVLKVSLPTSASFSFASIIFFQLLSAINGTIFTMAHFIHIIFVHQFPSKASCHLNPPKLAINESIFTRNQTCFTRSANSLRMTLLCALAKKPNSHGIPWIQKKPPITSTEIWTLVHLTENWFSYQGEEFRRRSDICLSVCHTTAKKGKALMSCFMPVLSFIEGHFQRISLLSLLSLAVWILMDASFHHKFIQLPHLGFEATHPGPYHAPPQSSQCPLRAKAWYAAKSNLGSYRGSKPEPWQSKCWFCDRTEVWTLSKTSSCTCWSSKGHPVHVKITSKKIAQEIQQWSPTKWKPLNICVSTIVILSKLAMQPKPPVDHGRVEPGCDTSGFDSPPCLDGQVTGGNGRNTCSVKAPNHPRLHLRLHLSNENIHHFKVVGVLWCPLHRQFVFRVIFKLQIEAI